MATRAYYESRAAARGLTKVPERQSDGSDVRSVPARLVVYGRGEAVLKINTFEFWLRSPLICSMLS